MSVVHNSWRSPLFMSFLVFIKWSILQNKSTIQSVVKQLKDTGQGLKKTAEDDVPRISPKNLQAMLINTEYQLVARTLFYAPNLVMKLI